ncbi:hypothetical protein COB64_02745 [Candidatus Wolfebacteria bacterium]|nr:MAG: hypothetical protein COB64_02745 [Candidatus Wolfebacteria bacterium]
MLKNLKIGTKLIIGFLLVALLVGVVGYFGLKASTDIEKSFTEVRDLGLPVISVVTEISSYAKRAEGHLYLYLMLGTIEDKEKFFSRIDSLDDHIELLVELEEKQKETQEENEEEEAIINEMRSGSKEMRRIGEALIAATEDFELESGYADPTYQGIFNEINETTSKVRRLGVQYAERETDKINRQSAVISASEVQSYIKRAEGHLQRYLILNTEIDKEKFFKRYTSLEEHVVILDNRVKDSEGRELVADIKAMLPSLLSTGESLIAAHDSAIAETGTFDPKKEQASLVQLNDIASSIRKSSVMLVKIESQFVGRSEQLTAAAARAQQTTLITIVVAMVIALSLAVIISRSISKPIQILTDKAGAISRGDLDIKINPVLLSRRDETGQLATAFNTMTDKLQESYVGLEEKVNKIDAILHSIGDGVFVIDHKYDITMFNKVAEDISGFTTKEVLGKRYESILKFVFEKDEKVNDVFIKKAMETGEIKKMSNNTVLIRKDGTKVPVADSAAPLKDNTGKVVGVVVVFRDVTKEREVDRAKTEFVSLASHQLRTPLSNINWYTEMLLNNEVGEKKEDQQKYLKKIYHNNQRMVELVNALLNVSRIDVGTLIFDVKPVDFKKIAESTVDELSSQINHKKLTLKKHYDTTLPTIQADPEAVQMIFQNLLSNAVKYTPSGGTVALSLEKEGPDILITVSDTGYGIAKSQHSKIFSKLFRAYNARKHDTDGNGLGLYIVKSIVEQAGGKIWFESKEDKGSTFYVKIPFKGMKKKEGSTSFA